MIDIGPELAILGHTNGLEVVDALTPPDLREHLVFLRPSLGRNDQRDVLTDRLLGRPAEQSLGRRVPRADDAVERFADDDVVGGIDDRGQAGVGELVLAPIVRKGIGHLAIPGGHAE